MKIKELEITKEMYLEAKRIENLYHSTDRFEVKSEEFRKYNNEWVKADEEFQKNFCDEFDTLEIVNEYERRGKNMSNLSYYDEMKEAILEEIEEEESVKDILKSSDCKEKIIENLIDYLWVDDLVTGNASGSYYCNAYKARKQCYNNTSDVIAALESYGYTRDLELFEILEALTDENYIDMDTMEINDDTFYKEEETLRWYIVNNFEEIKDLNFETLDVITRCYMLPTVVTKVVGSILK